MMTFSKEEINHLSKLASLELTEEEKTKFSEQLSETISYVEKVRELKTDNTQPTSQTTGLKNVFREDIVKPSLSSQKALSNAKDKYKGFFKTKPIFK